MNRSALHHDPSAPLDWSRFRADLEALYAALDAEVAQIGPRCALSGRCCRFTEYGHTLFLSAPEAALLVDEAPRPCRPLDRGDSCPWQDDAGRCTARNARPLGCRVYYCEPGYESQAALLSETFIGRLKRLVNQYGLSWNYAPLHWHLNQAQTQGRFPPPFSADVRAGMRGSEPAAAPKGADDGFLT